MRGTLTKREVKKYEYCIFLTFDDSIKSIL